MYSIENYTTLWKKFYSGDHETKIHGCTKQKNLGPYMVVTWVILG